MTHTLHYSRARRMMSFCLPCAALLSSAFVASAAAQSPLPTPKKSPDIPTLRAIAVLEWTGDDEAHPKKSRLVPISIYDGDQIQDAGLYLDRPEPLALAGEVEYILKKDGKTSGLFIIKNAGQEEGSWVGYGQWKPAPAPTRPAYAATAKVEDDDEDDDKPVLHRKHHDEDSSNKSGSASQSNSQSTDDDRPRLHKKDDSGNSTSSSGNTSSTGSDTDTDRPTLHRKDDSGSNTTSNSGSTASSDTDRPILKKPKSKPDDDTAHVSSLPQISDPDRPRLIRGQDTSHSIQVLPSLMGLPSNMHQTVGVSDVKDRPDHPWTYTWSNPADEARMKSLLEDQARQALGLATLPAAPAPASSAAPAKKTTAKKSAARKRTKPAPAAAPEPIPLEGEQFRTFELAYGSGATFVLSAHTSSPDPKERKFVTLIAQPDLYGNINVLHKNVTDAAHLDETPRMILVDAVDALADNRGELLFELRGATQRNFVLYRVLRGSAEQIFATTSTPFGSMASAQ